MPHTNSLITAFNSGMYPFRTSSMHFPTCMSIYPYISAFSFIVISHSMWGFPGGSEVKASAWNAGDPGLIPGSEDPLEKEMETHSSILALRIPWRKEPGRLQSMGFSRERYWSGSPFPSPGGLPTQGSNSGLPHCRQMLYRLSHQEALQKALPSP